MNRTVLVRLLTVLTLLIAAAAIGSGPRAVADARNEATLDVESSGERVWISDFIFRTTDEEAGVVCYVAELPSGAGIDCVPIGQTALGEETDPPSNRSQPTPSNRSPQTPSNQTESATITTGSDEPSSIDYVPPNAARSDVGAAANPQVG